MPARLKVEVQKARVRPTQILINAFGNERRPGSLLLEARKETGRIAKEMAQEMRDSLYRGRFKKAPLTPKYLEYKKRKGLDLRILIAYKKYVRNIGAVETDYGYRIGMVAQTRVDKRGKKTRRIPYVKLQRWLEYGTRKGRPGGMPARPHWRPMMRYWRKRRRQYGVRLRKIIGAELRRMLAKGQ